MAALCLLGTGCIKSMLTNGQISATRTASSAFNTIGDYELAKSAASAGLVQFEGMHVLAPDNEDALFLLLKGWVGYGFAFPEDDYEAASDAGNDDLAEYHKKRTRMAYERAVFYGVELMKAKASGFDEARRNDAPLREWLDKNFTSKDDAEFLFWLGYGWLSRANIAKDEPVLVADLFVSVALLERSMKLDPAYMHYAAQTALASYHARAAVAELDQAKTMFEDALTKTHRKSLVVQVNYASRYACLKNDRPLYEKLLNEVLAAEDPDPEQRLPNTVAKRRAKRYLEKPRMMDCGFDVSAPSGPPASSSPPSSSPPAPATAPAPSNPPAAPGAKPTAPKS